MLRYPLTITTNLTYSEPREFNLKQHTLLKGPSGAGKTSLIHALQVGLTGEAHEFGARSSAKSKALLTMKVHPSSSRNAFAEVSTEDWESAWDNGKVVKEAPEAWYFPVPDIYSAIAGSKPTLVAFLYDWFLDDKDCKDIWKGIKLVEAAKLWEEGGGKYTKEQPKERLSYLISAMKSSVSASRKEVTQMTSVREVLSGFAEGEEYEKAYKALKTQTLGAEKRLKRAQECLKGLQDAQETLVRKYRTRIEKQINNYLGEGNLKVGFEFLKSSAYVGRCLEGAVLPATSGSETARIVAAIGCAIAQENPEKAIALVLPDRGYDTKTLQIIQGQLVKAPCLTIIQTCSFPKLQTGWTELALKARRE
jgi:hypothetical protein